MTIAANTEGEPPVDRPKSSPSGQPASGGPRLLIKEMVKFLRARRLSLIGALLAGVAALSASVALEQISPGAAAFAGVVLIAAAVLISRLEGRQTSSDSASSLPGLPGQGVEGPTPIEQRVADAARQLLDALPDAVVMADEQGRMISANRRARADFVGEVYQRKHLATAIRRPAVLEAIQRVRDTGQDVQIEFSDLVPVERHFKAYVSPIALGPEDGRSVMLSVRDITQEKALEQMRADFVANASHELRTPLSSLSGFIETLRGHAKDDQNARERFLLIMQEQAQRMRRLIDDLLSLSRIELNEHVPPSDRVDLKGVVGDVAAALQPLAQALKTRIEVQIPPDLPDVNGTRDELVQVLQNLVDNALKYGGGTGPVEITGGLGAPPWVQGVVGEMCYLCITDHGEGIAREHIPRLTERFYRVDVKRSRERGGTGLGLAIVKHIVSRHRGRLHIKSELGQGSSFTVILPQASRAE